MPVMFPQDIEILMVRYVTHIGGDVKAELEKAAKMNGGSAWGVDRGRAMLWYLER
jgi:hypothetical protein